MMRPISRRFALAGASSALAAPAIAQDRPLRVGLMLPFTGPDAPVAEAIAAAFDMHLVQLGGKMGGRPVDLIRLDDESDPVKASSNVNALLGRDKADVMIGTVDPQVVLPLIQASREQRVPLIIPHAGNVGATRELCVPPVFRSSFSNWQPAYAIGRAMAARGVKKAAYMTWNFPTGRESVEGFRDGLAAGGAELTRTLIVPYPETNFQPYLTKLAELAPDAVGASFFGDGAVSFVRAYANSGLAKKTPLCGPGFLTESLLHLQGDAAEGVLTALHYDTGLQTPKNLTFRKDFSAFGGKDAGVHAVQGFDAAQMLAVGLAGTQGDPLAIADMAQAILTARIDSPRGPFSLSPSHNPIQTFWLREVRDGENRVIGTAAPAVTDPGTGCGMT